MKEKKTLTETTDIISAQPARMEGAAETKSAAEREDAAETKSAAETKNTANTEETKKYNEHNRDINSKTVFRDPVLCAQFLRDNCDIPVLKQVRPEDIEDISGRYLPYLGTQFDSDSVEKIRILDINREKGTKRKEEDRPPFLVALIDHKSLVDYDAAMQLLQYMVCIWTEYRRERESRQEGCANRKRFRYPVIIPIVYYEGKRRWTAPRRLSGRIADSGTYRQWIPDFEYELVRIHDYSNEELLEREDEMSLIMMFNKIQDASDLEQFLHIPRAQLDQIVQDSPGHVIEVIAKVIDSLCFKIDATDEEREQCVQKVRKRKMGYLFENMEHMSLQEERRKTEEERKRAEEQRQRADAAEEKLRIAEEQCKRADATEEKLRIAEEVIRQLKEKLQSSQ